jgi:hypothetical protein
LLFTMSTVFDAALSPPVSVCQHTDTQTHRHTHRQTDRQTNKQTDRSWHAPHHTKGVVVENLWHAIPYHTVPCHTIPYHTTIPRWYRPLAFWKRGNSRIFGVTRARREHLLILLLKIEDGNNDTPAYTCRLCSSLA